MNVLIVIIFLGAFTVVTLLMAAAGVVPRKRPSKRWPLSIRRSLPSPQILATRCSISASANPSVRFPY